MMREFYPELEIYKEHRLKVSAIHELHIEECGNPDGQPVLFNHGGPGGGINPKVHGRQFDPEIHRVIRFDQRGSGKSTPFADIRQNTTQDLVADIEKIREYLGIEQWIVAGHSWGTTLSVVYAQAYPERVQGILLTAMFICDKAACDWLFQEGASHIFPEAWAEFQALVPEDKRYDMMGAYRDMMFGEDEKLAVKAAKAWSIWEGHTVSLVPDLEVLSRFEQDSVALALARFECHYLGNATNPPGFLEDGQIVRDAYKIAHIPVTIIHGRYDMNCRHEGAYRLHKALPNSELITIAKGAHAVNDPETIDAHMRAAQALSQKVRLDHGGDRLEASL